MNRLKVILGTSAATLAAVALSGAERPNIVLILVDDMGYSDIGCYGGEIPTPNIDKLSQNGVRYTQFYNTARSCPSRAGLMTGLYPHQAGIGAMSEDPDQHGKKPKADPTIAPGYQGYLNRNSVTLAEVLKQAGYHTYMTGKWHLGMHDQSRWPLQRGFDRFYGILSGASSYLQPQGSRGLTLDNAQLPPPQAPYYTTDAFTDYAIEFMDSKKDDKPFFLYLAYNAPHWPLHAKDEDIKKFEGRYDAGWETIRGERFDRMVEMGIIDSKWGLGQWESRSWSELTDQERKNSAKRMEVYAAQVHCMDYNVGRVVDYLKKTKQLDNTLIVFLSDNGACAEPYSETGFGTVNDINTPSSWVSPSYGKPWAQVSNTPFRKYKVRAYEGGLTTPFIVSWGAKYSKYNNQIRRTPSFLCDIMATFIDAAGTKYPATYNGNDIKPLEGTSILPSIKKPNIVLHDYMFGEHFENCYAKHGNWKAVKDEKTKKWELYDMLSDRSETKDLATQNPEILNDLVSKWEQWANSHDVYPKKLQQVK